MLQQNNNNNCLDMAHRELLHECRRTNVSFTSALEFGAIPLIKGLRAWAVSGGYSKARRRAANGPRAQATCQPENRVGQRSWSGQVSGGYGHTLDTTSSLMRNPGVRQGGLGALVTVATLKGTEAGGRQTQTRCLFLKAQGRGSYICTVGNRGAGMRVAGPRTHTVILEGAKEEVRCSSRGAKASQDGTDDGGLFKAKPRAMRKWKKCSKTTEKRTAKGDIANQPERGENIAISDGQPLNVTPDHTITQCQKGRYISEDEGDHSPISEKADEISSANPCAKLGQQVEAGMSINQPDNCSDSDKVTNSDAHEDTKVSKHNIDLDSSQNIQNLPNPESSEAPQTDFDSLEKKISLDHSLVKTPSEVTVSIQKNQESERLLDHESLRLGEAGGLAIQSDGTPDTKSRAAPEGPAEKERRPSVCSPQHWEELIAEHGELEVQQSDKSSSRGFSTPTANITVTTIHSRPNPAPAATAAIATAIPALSEGEVEARGGDLPLLVNSEFLSEPARVDDGDKVAADEGSLDVEEEEEEDEFGAFMQAGGGQLWTDGFNDVQQLAAGEDYNCEELTSSADANDPASWASDWTVDHQSESTWIAFSQETEERKTEADGQWWPSPEKPNLPLSPFHNVSNVFLEAFPSEKSLREDPGFVPTLNQLLQGPAENSNTGEHKEQSLLDGLQDLDRMIGVKYKRAESLSCKLLLQSLHLERPSPECVAVRLKTNARFSPNLPASNQQLAANAKRRLSYDFNRNIMT